MSDLNGHGQTDPLNPLDYAPRWLRERPGRSAAMEEPRTERATRPQPARHAYARVRSLEPEVVPEPPGLERDREWRSMAIRRVLLAVVASAVAALFFVIVMARQPSASLASTLQNFTGAISGTPVAEESSKPALAEFRAMLVSAGDANPATAPGQPDQLLQQFLVWRKNAYPNVPPR